MASVRRAAKPGVRGGHGGVSPLSRPRVLFSYAFFLEGYTGLTVTCGAVVTLFVLMQMTGRVNWEHVFARSPARAGRPASGDPQPGLP